MLGIHHVRAHTVALAILSVTSACGIPVPGKLVPSLVEAQVQLAGVKIVPR